jgi:hypothetical protein
MPPSRWHFAVSALRFVIIDTFLRRFALEYIRFGLGSLPPLGTSLRHLQSYYFFRLHKLGQHKTHGLWIQCMGVACKLKVSRQWKMAAFMNESFAR